MHSSASDALRSASASAVRTSAAGPGQVAVTAPAEEMVLVERHAESKEAMAAGVWPRRADLFLYRYADDTLVHGLYDYASGLTSIVEEVRGVQLPLSDNERDTAIALAYADPAMRAQMADEYRLVTGRELTSAAQLDIRVFNYHAGANPDMETEEAAACDINRCAQLLILTDDNVTLYALPIVNLSTMRVVSNGQASATAAALASSDAGDDHADHRITRTRRQRHDEPTRGVHHKHEANTRNSGERRGAGGIGRCCLVCRHALVDDAARHGTE